MGKEVYLDNSATTRVLLPVAEAMVACLTGTYGNPSSLHKLGLEAEKKLAQARRQLAKLLGCKPKELIFTSGGTESNNLALKGIAGFYHQRGNHIITVKTEHPSVLAACESLEKHGYQVTYLDVNSYGEISLDQLASAITDETILVSIMLVNNELGTIQPIREAGEIIRNNPHRKKIFFHVDGVQAVGMLPVDLQQLPVDLFSFSAHKFHGPKGAGGLYVREGVQLTPLLDGGGQEQNLRSGTENVAGIVGMATALEVVTADLEAKTAKLKQLQQRLWQGIHEQLPASKLNTNLGQAAPHIVNISFPGIKGEVLLHYLESEGVYVSTGSACSSRSRHISHVLASIGLDYQEAEGTIRFSMSRETREEEVDYAVSKTVAGVQELMKVMGR